MAEPIAFEDEPTMQETAPDAHSRLAEAHARLVQDKGLQFDRTGFTPPEAPGWLHWIADAIRALGPLLQWLFWIGLALIAAGLLYVIVREILRLRAPPARPDAPDAAAAPDWRPDAQAARDLLAGADALAAEGRYAEAAHLLLLRSVEDIQKRRPRAVPISLTTREIEGLAGLPDAARPAFARIGRVVERSLFGGRPVDGADFLDCRSAYEAFALPDGWRA